MSSAVLRSVLFFESSPFLEDKDLISRISLLILHSFEVASRNFSKLTASPTAQAFKKACRRSNALKLLSIVGLFIARRETSIEIIDIIPPMRAETRFFER